jgi:hypothetical protein
VNIGVMNHPAVAGPDLQSADPGIAVEYFVEEDELPEILA